MRFGIWLSLNSLCYNSLNHLYHNPHGCKLLISQEKWQAIMMDISMKHYTILVTYEYNHNKTKILIFNNMYIVVHFLFLHLLHAMDGLPSAKHVAALGFQTDKCCIAWTCIGLFWFKCFVYLYYVSKIYNLNVWLFQVLNIWNTGILGPHRTLYEVCILAVSSCFQLFTFANLWIKFCASFTIGFTVTTWQLPLHTQLPEQNKTACLQTLGTS